jgi:hypothetical protein
MQGLTSRSKIPQAPRLDGDLKLGSRPAVTNAERAATRNAPARVGLKEFSWQVCPGNRGFYSYLPITISSTHVICVCNALLVRKREERAVLPNHDPCLEWWDEVNSTVQYSTVHDKTSSTQLCGTGLIIIIIMARMPSVRWIAIHWARSSSPPSRPSRRQQRKNARGLACCFSSGVLLRPVVTAML